MFYVWTANNMCSLCQHSKSVVLESYKILFTYSIFYSSTIIIYNVAFWTVWYT